MYYDDIDQYVDRFYREREVGPETRTPEETRVYPLGETVDLTPEAGPFDEFTNEEISWALEYLDPDHFPGARGDPTAVLLVLRMMRDIARR